MTATFLTLLPGEVTGPEQPHLILVGLPGAGKSTLARAVGSKLGRAVLDFDAEIERREGRNVAEIFAASGENYFRRCERDLTMELREVGNMILSPGGGWITNQDVVSLLRPPSRLVYLHVSPQVALERMGSEREQRPLLRRLDPLSELRRLYREREQFYRAADFYIDTELVAREELTDTVLDLTRSFDEVSS